MKNYSRQRDEILKTIKESNDYLTAETIYMRVKSQDPAVSRSTVYRNLGLLVDNNILEKVSMFTGADKYHYITEKIPHNHIVCYKCGKVCDFNYNFNLEEVNNIVSNQTGIEISKQGLIIEGICESCKNKNMEG